MLSSTVRAGAPKPVPAAAAVGVKPPAATSGRAASPPAVAAPVPVATAESLPGDVAVARRATVVRRPPAHARHPRFRDTPRDRTEQRRLGARDHGGLGSRRPT